MPNYEYECMGCGKRFELHRKISDGDREITCPKCGKKQPRRLFSNFARTYPRGGCTTSFG